jgi:RES domain-containing protein
LAELGIVADDLAGAWEDLAVREMKLPTWVLAERLIQTGHVGALVRSVAPSATEVDVNVVFWRWSRQAPHRVAVIDHHGRLPPDDTSWRAQ